MCGGDPLQTICGCSPLPLKLWCAPDRDGEVLGSGLTRARCALEMDPAAFQSQRTKQGRGKGGRGAEHQDRVANTQPCYVVSPFIYRPLPNQLSCVDRLPGRLEDDLFAAITADDLPWQNECRKVSSTHPSRSVVRARAGGCQLWRILCRSHFGCRPAAMVRPRFSRISRYPVPSPANIAEGIARR